MPKVAEIQFSSWDRKFDCVLNGNEIKVKDFVIVKTKTATDLGKVVRIKEVDEAALEKTNGDTGVIVRKAEQEDSQKLEKNNENKKQFLENCRQIIEKYHLNMKLIDVRVTYDGGHMVFAFSAEGRIDFRDLVKELTKIFKKSIRLHQVGIRDEMKTAGDVGACGRELCCRSFLKDLKSITSDLAEQQQVAHRGSDRISGVCGRLRCCLGYEQNGYEELAKKLPKIGSIINTPKGKGEVLGWHTLKQTVDVMLVDNETIIEIPIK